MSDLIKAALILGVFIFAAVAVWTYFSPYQSCVRSFTKGSVDRSAAARHCAIVISGR
jgi:hypothetical protein